MYLDRCMQEHEPELFKLYFSDWEDVHVWDDKGNQIFEFNYF